MLAIRGPSFHLVCLHRNIIEIAHHPIEGINQNNLCYHCRIICLLVTMDPETPITDELQPSIFRWTLGFLMVGACWGLTTPFMRRAAM